MVVLRSPHHKKSDSVFAKIGMSLFGLVFLCAGLVFVGLIVSITIKNIKTRTWKKTPCTITDSTVETVNDGYAVKVQYAYTVNERVYHSKQFQSGRSSIIKKNINEADALSHRYSIDKRTFCYVSPNNPSEAILQQGSLLIGLLVLFPMFFVLIGGGIIYGTWFSSAKAPKTYSLSEKASRKKFGKKFQPLFFVILFFIGLGVGYYFIFPGIIGSLRSKNWIKIPCIVTSSRVQSHRGDDTTTYSVDIVYEYSFNEKQYRSGRYKFIGGSSSGYRSKAAVVRQYPPGKAAVCYVNPDNPSEAVLIRELGAEAFLVLIPILFMIIGLAGALNSLKDKQNSRSFRNLSESSNLSEKSLEPHAHVHVHVHAQSGQMVLKPTISAAGKVIISILSSIIWNGINSIFLYQAIQSWRAGRPNYFLTVFQIPFVLIGVVLIGSIFYFAMACFNPRPIITLLKNTIRLGDTVPMRWTTDGNVYKIQHFTLSLIGEETATYRRGTSSYTDSNTFYKKILVDDLDPESIRRGEADVTIPSESMHSFKSKNNSIAWKISMHCDVPRWPDSRDDFEITVHPLSVEDS